MRSLLTCAAPDNGLEDKEKTAPATPRNCCACDEIAQAARAGPIESVSTVSGVGIAQAGVGSRGDIGMHQVLIVGAGPVGLTMAIELARFGVQVRIIDRSPHPTETSKALVVWSRTLELMDRMGCTQAFLNAGLRARGASIRNGRTVLGHADFGTIASPYDFALMIPQSETERLLTAHLASLGVAVEREVELLGFGEQPSYVAARRLRSVHSAALMNRTMSGASTSRASGRPATACGYYHSPSPTR